jgi:hypothetical protein
VGTGGSPIARDALVAEAGLNRTLSLKNGPPRGTSGVTKPGATRLEIGGVSRSSMDRRGSNGCASSFFLAKQSEKVLEYHNAQEVGDGPEGEHRKHYPY